MAVVGVLLVGGGAYLMWYAWQSHQSKSPVTPLADAKTKIRGAGSGTSPAPAVSGG